MLIVTQLPRFKDYIHLIHKGKTIVHKKASDLSWKMNRSTIHRFNRPVPLTPFQFRPFFLTDTFIFIIHSCICKNEPNVLCFPTGIEVDELVWWCHQLFPVIRENITSKICSVQEYSYIFNLKQKQHFIFEVMFEDLRMPALLSCTL